MPKANEKDMRDIPEEARKEMEFIFVEKIEEVLAAVIPGIYDRAEAGVPAA